MRPYPLALALVVVACTSRDERTDVDTSSAATTMSGDSAASTDSTSRHDGAARSATPVDSSEGTRRGTGASTPATPRASTPPGTQSVGSDSLPSRSGAPRDSTATGLLPNARPAGTIMVDVNRLPTGDSTRRVAPLPPEPSLEKKPSRAAADSAAARRRRDSTDRPGAGE